MHDFAARTMTHAHEMKYRNGYLMEGRWCGSEGCGGRQGGTREHASINEMYTTPARDPKQ